MPEIAARADANIGSLYRFFPNKDALAEALMNQYAEALRAEYAPGVLLAPIVELLPH
jgi:AcrR family transcriptional regulator